MVPTNFTDFGVLYRNTADMISMSAADMIVSLHIVGW